MHDIVIRGGSILDGTGAAARTADVALRDGRIIEVGAVSGRGRQELDVHGALVTPGWVDIHTHYDAQATWDSGLTPTGYHGVTTLVMGNCGVGFAPAKSDRHQWLIELMEGVEDIPGSALADGIQWEWESFPEYLDALARRRWVADVGTQVPHAAVRGYVMGDRSADGNEATPEDLSAMTAIVHEALLAGALGFSTSRTPLHKSVHGDLVPGTSAEPAEVIAISDAIRRAGHGVFQCALHHPDVPQEMWWLKEIARNTGGYASFNFNISDMAPDIWRDMLRALDEANAEGCRVVGQVAGRPVGILQCWDGTVNPFLGRPTYEALKMLPQPERLRRLAEPETRARILAEEAVNPTPLMRFICSSYHRMWRFTGESDYEPAAEHSLAAVAARQGCDPAGLAYDHLNSDGGKGLLYFPFLNYAAGDLAPLYEMHRHPHTRMGLADGGAHCGTICDASMPTFMLAFWGRDRLRGPKLDLAEIVRRQTSETAALYGLNDRGRIAPGLRGDINVIDYQALSLEAPHMVWDLPSGAPRFMQRPKGYLATLCAGEVTVRDDEFTGALPGRLVRGAR